ncbi:MAG: metallophosphoesterase [Sphingobacteriales bacterium]
MKNIKTHSSKLITGLMIALSFFLTVSCYSQTIKKQEAVKKCLIVSDIHFDPLFGSHKDTLLRRKLQGASFDEWKKLFESSDPQMIINASLLYQDANYGVLKSALDNMKRRLPHPAFIIIGGDFIWHGAKPADSVLKKKCIRFIARLFKEYFPGVTIVPAMGNNDTYGQDYALQDATFLNDFAEAWSANLPKASADELKKQGYYTTETGNLKIMVYNSALLNAGTNYPQAATMLNWLQSNLAEAKTKNVWLLTHIPPGTNVYNNSNFWNPGYTQTFINTVVKYAPKVKLSIAAHTHFNDFRVFYNVANEPVSYMRIVPSICSNHGNNPSFKVAEFNRTDGRVIKETNYYLNLVAIPKDKTKDALDWTDTLNLPSTLQLSKVNAKGLSEYIDKAKADHSFALIDAYRKFYTVGTNIDSSIRVSRVNYLKYFKADSLKAK